MALMATQPTCRKPRPRGAASAPAAQAIQDLEFIRETLRNAGSFTAVPGWGAVALGATALVAAWLAAPRAGTRAWLWVWLGEAALAAAIGAVAMARKARVTGSPLLSGPGRKFLASCLPAMVAGALLTVVLARAGLQGLLPALWLLLYGAAVVSGGAQSVEAVPVMGLSFMFLGAVALFSPAGWGDGFMAAGFGALHLIFGGVIARKYGG